MVIIMPQIELLDEQTIDKIAAGEVVERPSSVVKELVENAIDAGASAVTVEIRDGGTTMIRVTDNGCGIESGQIPIAFYRHSTSKIRTVEDLMTISSLGFRGEALSSIAAVAQVELISKTPDSLTGCRYVIEGGKERSVEEVGAPDGTTFIVKNLFYNTPARRKFLKTPQTEAGYISDMMERIALSHPEISFKFVNNGQIRLHTPGNSRLMDAIYQVYGRDTAANLLEVREDFDTFSVSGYIGKPVISRGNRNFENYFINGRYVRSSLIAKAIEDGYHGFLMQHKYPFTVLALSLDGKRVDVNVHPNKMELRFADGEEIYRKLSELIARTLKEQELITDVSVDEEKPASARPAYDKKEIPEPFETNRIAQAERKSAKTVSESCGAEPEPGGVGSGHGSEEPGYGGSDKTPGGEKKTGGKKDPGTKMREGMRYGEGSGSVTSGAGASGSGAQPAGGAAYGAALGETSETRGAAGPEPGTVSGTVKPRQMELSDYTGDETRLLSEEARPSHRIIGQLFDTYWLVEYGDRFYMIDQHAAHEKVKYEEMMRAYRERECFSQMISPPILLTLSMQEEELLNKYIDDFEKLGFSIEPFGGREYAVRAVPANLYGLNAQDLLSEMVDDLGTLTDRDTPDMVAEKIASMSCKAAVKGNQSLSGAEAEQLIDDLLKLENPYFCPHGRPVIVSMTRQEIEKKFKRIV